VDKRGEFKELLLEVEPEFVPVKGELGEE